MSARRPQVNWGVEEQGKTSVKRGGRKLGKRKQKRTEVKGRWREDREKEKPERNWKENWGKGTKNHTLALQYIKLGSYTYDKHWIWQLHQLSIYFSKKDCVTMFLIKHNWRDKCRHVPNAIEYTSVRFMRIDKYMQITAIRWRRSSVFHIQCHKIHGNNANVQTNQLKFVLVDVDDDDVVHVNK